jgi:phage-related minor tail protein|uniref:Minor tail protein n=1 Tax=Siphoviridae sp. ctGyV19 TaxID=2826225 RepID=A0A8S5MUR4_9CAUD|nr:MAG TPA: minor tail protein [Siphoviridae sp. ctGyV19]
MAGKGDGEVVYTLRADDSDLEGDLKSAEKKIEKSTEDTAAKSEQAEKETAETKKKVKEDVTQHHKQQNEEQEKSDEESSQKREETAKGHGEKLKSIAGGAAKAIGTGMLAAGTAVVGVGVAAVNTANDFDQAMNQFVASTGIGTEYTERYKKLMEDVYTNNYGDSFEDVADAMSQIRQQIGPVVDDWDPEGLQEFTESAFALRDTFGLDIQESVRAAGTMMDQFCMDGTDAMDMIAAGAQNGLDFSGEFLDSINEYSVHFSKMGMDADDMFKIFQKGSDSGAFNLDKIGDAVKEMSIRVLDGSDTTKEGFETIGLNADEMASKFAAGGDSAKEAFKQTIDALAGIEDPLAQNTAGVDLFGTMWEDLGPDAVTALADIQDGAYDTADAMEGIKAVKYDDLGSMFEGLKRAVEVLLIPLGEQLIPLLSDLIKDVLPLIEESLPPLIEMIAGFAEQLMPIIQDILPILLETITALGEPLMQLIEEILPVILDLFSQVAPLLGEFIEAILPILVELFQALIPPLIEIISAALPPLIELINALLPIFQIVIQLLEPIIGLFLDLLGPIVDLINQALIPLVEALQPIIETITDFLIPILETLMKVFETIFGGIVSLVEREIKRITDILGSIVDFVKNVFAGNWEGAWQNIVDIFHNVIDGIVDFFKAPLNAIVDGWNSLADSIGYFEIPEWVPFVGGGTFSLPTLPRLKVGMDYVPSDYYPAYLDEGEAVLTKQENAMYRQLGGLQGMFALQNQQSVALAQQSAAIDYERMGRETAKAMKGMGVYLDKRPVGKIIAPVVSEEMGKVNERRT